MPQENPGLEDLARAAFDALNRDDLDGFLDLVDPEVEFTSMIAEAEGEAFHGHEGVRRWWEVVRGRFTEVHWDYRLARDRGDRAVAKLQIRGTLSGVELTQPMWLATAVRDGKATWWGFFRTEAEALEAAALRE